MENQDDFAARIVGRLFAISMTFASLQQSVTGAHMRNALSRIVEDCDETIAEVRASIFGLIPDAPDDPTAV